MINGLRDNNTNTKGKERKDTEIVCWAQRLVIAEGVMRTSCKQN